MYRYTLAEHTKTMEGLLAHIATADCFITRPHRALECGILTAWWQSRVEGDPAVRRQRRACQVPIAAAPEKQAPGDTLSLS